MSKLRTFIAVEVLPAVRKRALDLIERLRQSEANVKWVSAAELHWTLKFLGDVETNELPALCDAVAAAVKNLSRFDINAIGAGAFPSAHRPRTIWLGVREGEAEFVSLHDCIERVLAPLGFREEQRRFRPHLTIGRVRRSPHGVEQLGQAVIEHADFAAGEMAVTEVGVYSSQLLRHGPVYERLSSVSLPQ